MTIQFPNPILGGQFAATVQDNSGNPANVVDKDLPFSIDLNVTLDPGTAPILGGQFVCSTYVDAIGGPSEAQIGTPATIAMNGSANYSAQIPVPAHTLPLNPADSGVYRLVVVAIHEHPAGTPTGVSGFVDGGLIQFT